MVEIGFDEFSKEEIVAKVNRYGPARVLVDKSGESVTPRRARSRGIGYDVVFVRKDGWTLGAPSALEEVARKMWDGEWALVLKRGEEIR